MMAVIIALHTLRLEWLESAKLWFVRAPWAVKLLIFVAAVQLTIQFMSAEVKPFIYFQF